MDKPNENTQNIQLLAKKLLGKQLVTADDLEKFVIDVANVFSQYKSATSTINKETKDTLNLIVKQVNIEHDRILKDVEQTSLSSRFALTEQLKNTLEQCKKMREDMSKMTLVHGKDGADGQDGEDGKDGKDGSPDTPDEVVDKVNKSSKKINATQIEGVDKLATTDNLNRAIEILDKRSQFLINKNVKHDATLTGSGTDADPLRVVPTTGGVTFYVETPSGTIDGANNAFTVTSTITKILSIHLNGQFVHPVEYSSTGSTVTFVTAPDVSFAGLPFTIVYV